MNYALCLLFLLYEVLANDLFTTPTDSTVSRTTTYDFTFYTQSGVTTSSGSAVTITFPAQYANRLTTGSTTCQLDVWPASLAPNPTPTCTLSELVVTINGLFPSSVVFPTFQIFTIKVDGIRNPPAAVTTGNFIARIDTSTGSTYSVTGQGIGFTASTMDCSLSVSPTTVNQNGQLIVSFTTAEFPINSSLQLKLPLYWPRSILESTTNRIITSTSITCSPLSNAAAAISCSYVVVGSDFIVTVNALTNQPFINTQISFSLGTILNPPSTQPQGNIQIISFLQGSRMSSCTNEDVSSTTAGSLSSASFLISPSLVNSQGQGRLQFTVNSYFAPTDYITIQIPSEIGVSRLSSIFIPNGNLVITPNRTGSKVTITGVTIFQGNSISILFRNLTNPPSQATTTSFTVNTHRNWFLVQTISSGITYSATRTTIPSATLTCDSLQVGVTTNCAVTFTLGQSLTSNSAAIISFPTAYQGKVGSCSPSPCTVTSTTATFTSLVSTAKGASLTLRLLSVVNPYTLGSTTTLYLRTLYQSSNPNSVVQELTTGLSVVLVGRVMSAFNVAVNSSSQVVSNFPTAYFFTISNNNPLPAMAYLVIEFPTQINFNNPTSTTCLYGSLSIFCSYDTNTRLLTLSYFSSSALAVSGLASSQVEIRNLINPPSTYPTASFRIYLYNSANQVLQYLTGGLSYQVSMPANFFSLTLQPNNTINSAETTMTVSFREVGSNYQNNSLLLVSFPTLINIQFTQCTALSSNLMSVYCSSSNTHQLKIELMFSFLSTTTTTRILISSYKNYPSLKPYAVQVDLYEDNFMQTKLSSNQLALISLQNTAVGNIGVEQFSWNVPRLGSSSNFNIRINRMDSLSFAYLILTLPLEFSISAVTCSLPNDLTCSIISGSSVRIVANSTMSLPLSFSLNNIITPTFSPSSPIYLQSFTSDNFRVDDNTAMSFSTLCTLPCRTCPVNQSTVCQSCYNNETWVGGAIYLNASVCLSICGSGRFLNSNTNSCQLCGAGCLTCSSLTTCLSCNSTFLFNSSCLPQCPFGYYGFNSQCILCPSATLFCASCPNSHQCSSCVSGYFLYNLQCYSDCPALITYPNLANNTCDPCPANCTNCQGNSSFVRCTVCNTGYLLDSHRCYLQCVTSGLLASNGICTGCDLPCKTCSNSVSNCTSCFSNSSSPFYYNFACFSICAPGYYGNTFTASCQPCTHPCEYCLSSSVTSCLTCRSGFFIHNTSCETTCPPGYYNSSGRCHLCVLPCITCSTQLICLSCSNGTYLFQQRCLSACPAGMTIINGNQCLVCSSTCKTCSSASVCTSCHPSAYLYNSTCISLCPSGTYADSNSLKCQSCLSPCSTCFNSSFCFSCIDTSKFVVSGACVNCNSPCRSCSLSIDNCTSCLSSSSTPFYLDLNCYSSCPNGYYSDNITSRCLTCQSPCLNCQNNNSTCKSCISNMYFLLNLCLPTCPSTYFNNITVCSNCVSPCTTCSSATVCLSCINGTFLSGSSCVSDCGVGLTVINNSICLTCSSNCKTCLSANPNSCTSCYTTFFLFNVACNYTCIDRYYPDSSTSTCLPCIHPCQLCTSAFICSTCVDPLLFLVNGSCLSCSSPCLSCSGLRTTCTACQTNSSSPYLVNSTCLASCPATFYDNGAFLCLKCNSPCQTCISSSSTYCLSCLSGYFFLNNVCLVACPATFWPNITICSPCVHPCLTCSNAATCISCASSLYLLGSSCVTNCSLGMSIINGSKCDYCSSICQTCLSSSVTSCTSCYPTTFLHGSTCLTVCPNATYADSTLKRCLPCLAPCSFCANSNFCLSCLDSSLFLINGTCIGCTSPCSTCNSTPTTCTSCSSANAQKYLLNSRCLSSCPATYFASDLLGQCIACTSPCQTCNNASVSSCITCTINYLFYVGSCLTSCPAGTYSSGVLCVPCSYPCQRCFDNITCISCQFGLFLQGSRCVSNCSSGMVPVNATYCQYCSSICLTCRSSNTSACTSCPTNQYLFSSSCLNSCPDFFYPDTTSGSCLSCVSPCHKCSSLTLCLSCLDSSLFLVNSTCVGCLSPCLTCATSRNNCTSCDILSSFSIFHNNQCLSACPSGTYISAFRCVACVIPCQTCFNASTSACQSCVNGYLFMSGSCLLGCPPGYYSNNITCLACNSSCATCSSLSICLSCPSGQFLLGSLCVSSCPNGTVSNNTASGGICQFCVASCNTCASSNSNFCTSCSSPSFLRSGACVSNCSNGFYSNTVSRSCQLCSLPCSHCISPTQCLSCLDPATFLLNFQCVSCQFPCLTCSNNVNNCTACNTSSTHPYIYGSTCLTTCPSTYYNSPTFTCDLCASPCYTCSAAGNQSCISCLINYLQLNNTCLNVCPSGYYSISNQCVLCTSPCMTCYGAGNNSCTSCTSGLFLLGSVCVANCSGMAVSGNICQYCVSSCLSCLSHNNSLCTSCNPSLFLFNYQCLINCSIGLYPDSGSSQCLNCIAPCLTCTSATSCLSCIDNAKFLINSACIGCSHPCFTCSSSINNCTSCNTTSNFPFLHQNQCLSSCPITFYNASSTTCLKCNSPCETCTSSSISSCLTCLTGYYMLNSTCFVACPITYYPSINQCSSCSPPCYACLNSPTVCVSCVSGFFLRGQACVSNCSIGQIVVNGSVCMICVGNCLTCMSNNFSYCTSCPSGTFLLQGICHSSCPSQFYNHVTTRTCIGCISPCLTCTSDVLCTSCDLSTLFLIGYSCQTCNSLCLTCNGTQTNCTSCNISSSNPFYLENSCLTVCPSTHYNNGAFRCLLCTYPCLTCSTSSNRSCISCQYGYSQLGSDCYLTCPIGHFSNNTHCIACNSSVCLTCIFSSSTCLSCSGGLYLYGSTCVPACPSGMSIINGSVCMSCSSGCFTCLSSNNSFCTSCFNNTYLYMGGCLATCPSLFFQHNPSLSCLLCQSPCAQCLSVLECLSCSNPLMFLQNNTCVSSCTYPLVGINNTCYRCSSQCLTCTITVSTCLLCASNFFYFPSTFSCQLICSFYRLQANLSTSGNIQCLNACPQAFYVSGVNCLPCPTGCSSCSDLSNCSSCADFYSFYRNLCYLPCPAQAPYSINRTCLLCNINFCDICLNTTHCQTCAATFLLIRLSTSSNCIASCPSGKTYNDSLQQCIQNVANTTNSTTRDVLVASSGIPAYSLLISQAVLISIVFLIKFSFPTTQMPIVVLIVFTLVSTASMFHILSIQLKNSSMLRGEGIVSISTCLFLSAISVQSLVSIGSVVALIKIMDAQFVKKFKQYTITYTAIILFSIVDSGVLFLLVSNIFDLACFSIPFASTSLQTILKVTLVFSLLVKSLNMAYSVIHLITQPTTGRLLVQTSTFSLDNGYMIQFLIIAFLCFVCVIYLLCKGTGDQKVENLKEQSHQSLMDDKSVFDKRNQSDSQIIMQLDNSDLVVDVNSLKDLNQISFANQQRKTRKKITPAEMLQIMGNQQEDVQNQIDLSDQINANNIFFVQQEQAQENSKENYNQSQHKYIMADDKNQKSQEKVSQTEKKELKAQQQDLRSKKKSSKVQVQQFKNNELKVSAQKKLQNNPDGYQIIDNNRLTDSFTPILFQEDNSEPTQALQINLLTKTLKINGIQQPQQQPSNNIQPEIAIADPTEKTKTEIINIFSADNNQKEHGQKYSPSRISKYQPNRQIQKQFDNSYFDDAHRFHRYKQQQKIEEEAKGVSIIFQIVNQDYEEGQDQNNKVLDKKKVVQPQIEADDDRLATLVSKELQKQIINFQQDDFSFQEQKIQDLKPGKNTPINNSFFEESSYTQFKPSEGLQGKRPPQSRLKKPQIPLPKNQIQKQIINVYANKPRKPRKPRYPEVPMPSKQTKYIQFSIEQKPFQEQQKLPQPQARPFFSGQIKPLRKQSRGSGDFRDSDEVAQKPSTKLRKSSFKKVGEMILQGQSSGRK